MPAPPVAGGRKKGGATVYLKVRPVKLSEIIRCEPVMDVDLHKPTYRCIVGNDLRGYIQNYLSFGINLLITKG